MADLTPVTDRLNDVEITANAPLTETLMRRIGSNINFLLDFLGIADGETTPSGDLNELISALNLVGNHTMDEQVNWDGTTGTINIGTFTKQKFVNQVFYFYIATNVTTSLTFNPTGNNSLILNVDGGGNRSLPYWQINNGSPAVPGVPAAATLDVGNDYLGSYQFNRDTAINERRYSKALNLGQYQNSTFGGVVNEFLLPIGELDYRDAGTNFQLLFNVGGVALLPGITKRIYRGYRLNAGSFGF